MRLISYLVIGVASFERDYNDGQGWRTLHSQEVSASAPWLKLAKLFLRMKVRLLSWRLNKRFHGKKKDVFKGEMFGYELPII